RFGLPASPPEALAAAIKRADQLAAWFEATQLAGFSDVEAERYFGRPRGFTAAAFDLTPRPTKSVEAEFLARFRSIDAARESQDGPTAPAVRGGRETTE